jgi:predicted enzyme related to lactoylglutathione lyase
MSRNYAASKAFYTEVFGYHLQEIGEGDFRYSVASLDGTRPIGGIGEIPAAAPAEVPSHWMVYFAVESCDDAARRVVELGGSVMQQPFDTPYGRMALVAGPQGETFSVMRLALTAPDPED